MRVLVTGANGFIGRHVVRAIGEVSPHTPVLRMDRHAARDGEAGGYLRCDIERSDVATLTRILGECDVTAIVNCAGATESDAVVLQAANVDLVAKLVEASARAGGGMVVCQIGSAAEYAMLPRPQRTGEDCPTTPVGDYGRSKLAASNLVLDATRRGRLLGYVLRLFNPIGVGMPGTQLVGRVLEHLRRGRPEPLRLGNLASYRDYVDVGDAARAVAMSLLQARALRGGVLNVGSGVAKSTRSLVRGILQASGGGTFLEDANVGSARSEWAAWQEADISNAGAALGWEPRIAFEETVRRLGAVAGTAPRD